MVHCDLPLTLPPKTLPSSPSSSPLTTLSDGHAKQIAQSADATEAPHPFVVVDGEAFTSDAKTGDDANETFQAYRTVNKVRVDNEPQPVSTPNKASGWSWTTRKEYLNDPESTRQGGTTIETEQDWMCRRLGPSPEIPGIIYSKQTLKILEKLWGARLCAGMEDKIVQDVLREVHGKMPTEHHKLLCFGAWTFQANQMKILSTPWKDFYRFTFHEKLETEKRHIFASMARSWNSALGSQNKTAGEIAEAWRAVIWTISEFIKQQLQKLNYHLCSCPNSQPHSMTALWKILQILNNSEKSTTKERVKQVVFACTALIVHDFIIEEYGAISQHTCEDSRKAVLSAIQGLDGARGLSSDIQADLSNVIAYSQRLKSGEASSLDLGAFKDLGLAE